MNKQEFNISFLKKKNSNINFSQYVIFLFLIFVHLKKQKLILLLNVIWPITCTGDLRKTQQILGIHVSFPHQITWQDDVYQFHWLKHVSPSTVSNIRRGFSTLRPQGFFLVFHSSLLHCAFTQCNRKHESLCKSVDLDFFLLVIS